MTEPITGFASIVGLLAVYKGERTKRADQSAEDFKAWLAEHRHDEVVERLDANAGLLDAINELLHRQHDAVMSELSSINSMLSMVAAHLGLLAPVAAALPAQETLSEQAMALLRGMVKSGSGEVWEVRTRGEHSFDGSGDEPFSFEPAEPVFIEDDLEKLCDFGYLTLRHGSRGTRQFHLTPAGATVGQNG